MEINIVAHRKGIVDFINGFLRDNGLIFFSDKNYEKDGIIFGDEINIEDFVDKDIFINIGSKSDFELKIKSLSHRPFLEDKIDFIYVTNFWYKNELKITNTSFIWTPSHSLNAKYNGIALKKRVKCCFKQGMQTKDSRYDTFNKVLHKYYWAIGVDDHLDKLYYNGGVIPICPLLK